MNQDLVFLATAWGPNYGGINAFNSLIVPHIAKIVTCNVYCIVLQVGDIVHDNTINNLTILSLEYERSDFKDSDIYDIGDLLTSHQINPGWFIGHDVITGPMAIKCGNRFPQSNIGIIHHMNYEAYGSYKYNDPTELMDKIDIQRRTLAAADLVFAIGPKLVHSASDKIGDSEIVEIIPGLSVVESMEMPERFSAIVYGRLERSNILLKQFRLAVAGFGRASRGADNPLGGDSRITLVGFPESEIESHKHELEVLGEHEAGRAIQLHGFPYMNNQAELVDHLRRHSTAIVVSIHEGFGLSGWEAIGAGVPLVISRNTGVYKLLEERLGGAALGCISPIEIRGSLHSKEYTERDVKNVADALRGIRGAEERRKRDAMNLREMILGEKLDWERAAIDMALSCGLPMTEKTRIKEAAYDDKTSNIPAPSYAKLFGVDELIDEIVELTQASASPRIIQITGLGGLGKTAIIHSAATRISQFVNKVAWITIRPNEFQASPETSEPLPTTRDTPEMIAANIADQLGMSDVVHAEPESRIETLVSRLNGDTTLLVCDNLETQNDLALIEPFLNAGIIGGNLRILVGSRVPLQEHFAAIHRALDELEPADSVKLIRYEAELRGLEHIVHAPSEMLHRIHSVVGGNPLALKLTLGLMRHLPLEQTLQRLKSARGDKVDRLYTFIYRSAWDMLSADGRNVLVQMPHFPIQGATWSRIKSVSGLDDEVLTDAIRELVDMSLLVPGQFIDDTRNYSVHRLTLRFIEQEILD